jgi:hypothetical protein
MQQLVRLLSFLLLPLALFTACDSGGSNEEAEINNEFSFTITPTSSSSTADAAATRSQTDVDGFSFFVDTEDIEDTQEQAFVIYLSGGDSGSNLAQGLFGFVARQSTQPDEGTYNLADLQGTPSSTAFIGALYEDVQNITEEGAPYYFVQSGTLNLQESSDNEVSGELTATATEYTIEGSGADIQITEQSVQITGQFTAKNLDTYVPFDQYTSPPSN